MESHPTRTTEYQCMPLTFNNLIENSNTVKIFIRPLVPKYVETSVVDPDPDPVGSGLIGSPESGSGKIPDPDPLSTKRPL